MNSSGFRPARSKSNPLKRLNDSSRREVSLGTPSRKKSKSESPSKSRQSSVSILSSRPNSTHSQELKKLGSFSSVDPSKFYENPKSLLEKQYERNLLKHIPLEAGEDFVPLESDPQSFDGASAESPLEALKSEPDIDEESEDEEPLSNEAVLSIFNSSQDTDLEVGLLLKAANMYVQKAHSSVLGCNTVEGTQVYHTYIKQALRLLHFSIDEYHGSLDPASMSAIYQSLAIVYFQETEETEKAEQNINKAVAIATRHGLTRLKVACELWHCRILESLRSSTLASVYNERQACYSESGLEGVASLFSLAKSSSLAASDSVLKTARQPGVADQAHHLMKVLQLLYSASQALYRGSPTAAKDSINACRTTFAANSVPPQLHALARLLNLLYYIHANDVERGRAHIMKISEFISRQRKQGWPEWRQDGLICVSVPVSQSTEGTVPFSVQWLDPEEFSIIFYFLSGLLLLSDFALLKKATKVFTSCLEMLNKKLQELTDSKGSGEMFSVQFLTDKIVRLSFIRYSVIYYRIWMNFMHNNDFTGIQQIADFLQCFDDNSFTNEEMTYYKILVPKFLYLVGLHHQSRGDMNAAKFYFFKVRQASQDEPQDHTGSQMQQDLGIGCEFLAPKEEFSELFLFSTLHLVIITESELSFYHSDRSSKSGDQIELHKSLHVYYQDLDKALNGAASKSFVESNKLLQLSYKLVLSTVLSKGFTSEHKEVPSGFVSEIGQLRRSSKLHGFLKALSSFISSKLSANMDESIRYLRSAVANLREGEDASQLLGAFMNADSKGKHHLEADVAAKLHIKFGSYTEGAKAALQFESTSFKC